MSSQTFTALACPSWCEDEPNHDADNVVDESGRVHWALSMGGTLLGFDDVSQTWQWVSLDIPTLVGSQSPAGTASEVAMNLRKAAAGVLRSAEWLEGLR